MQACLGNAAMAKQKGAKRRWQYGLGRATVFASDAKSRWSADWVAWPGFDILWTNIFRDLLPRGTESEAIVGVVERGREVAAE